MMDDKQRAELLAIAQQMATINYWSISLHSAWKRHFPPAVAIEMLTENADLTAMLKERDELAEKLAARIGELTDKMEWAERVEREYNECAAKLERAETAMKQARSWDAKGCVCGRCVAIDAYFNPPPEESK